MVEPPLIEDVFVWSDPLPNNLYSLRLVSTLAITTHPRCCEDCARLVADKVANGKDPKEARRPAPHIIAIATIWRSPGGSNLAGGAGAAYEKRSSRLALMAKSAVAILLRPSRSARSETGARAAAAGAALRRARSSWRRCRAWRGRARAPRARRMRARTRPTLHAISHATPHAGSRAGHRTRSRKRHRMRDRGATRAAARNATRGGFPCVSLTRRDSVTLPVSDCDEVSELPIEKRRDYVCWSSNCVESCGVVWSFVAKWFTGRFSSRSRISMHISKDPIMRTAHNSPARPIRLEARALVSSLGTRDYKGSHTIPIITPL